MKKAMKIGLFVCLVAMLGAMLLTACESSAEKATKMLENTTEDCKKYLADERYEKLPRLYASVSKYPECQVEIERQLKAHAAEAVTEQDAKRVPKVYRALQKTELFETLMDGILEGADALYEDSYIDFMIFHQALTEEQFYLEELDQRVLDYVRAEVEAKDYTDASTYIRIVYHCDACVAWLQQFYENLMESYLERRQYEEAVLLYSHMDYVDLKDDKVGAMWLNYAYALMDEEKYADAQYLLYELRDRKHAVYDLDAQFALRLATLHIYIEKGEFDQAREWANSFFGETRDKLLEVLQAYIGDSVSGDGSSS